MDAKAKIIAVIGSIPPSFGYMENISETCKKHHTHADIVKHLSISFQVESLAI